MTESIVSAIRGAMQARGYTFFSDGDWNLNLVGIRGLRRQAGAYDDQICCLYRVGGIWRTHVWAATTDPSPAYLQRPINPAGTAILCPGQYRGSHKIGLHKKRPALVQVAPVRVWRDDDRDTELDWDPSDPGKAGDYGINIHDATSSQPSAGCQVFANKYELQALLEICSTSAPRWGNRFTYTLLEGSGLAVR